MRWCIAVDIDGEHDEGTGNGLEHFFENALQFGFDDFVVGGFEFWWRDTGNLPLVVGKDIDAMTGVSLQRRLNTVTESPAFFEDGYNATVA